MQTSVELIQSKAFTDDLTPYMDEAKTMYPGGRFQKIVRGFDRIFRRGLVEFTDQYNAMVVADREQRAELAAASLVDAAVELTVQDYFKPDLEGVVPAGGVIG